MAYRAEFREALELLALVGKAFVELGIEPPILVGGAAVEFFTSSAVTTGDFDFVTPYQDKLEAAVIALGFERVLEPGYLTRSLIHRELGFGVQVVSGALMDGNAARGREKTVSVGAGLLRFIAIEDLIADRAAQAYATTPPRNDMLDQALKLRILAESIDDAYLDRRLAVETNGAFTLGMLDALAEARNRERNES